MELGDVREVKRRGNWRMEWVTTTLHTTSEHGVSTITTADAHTSAASNRLSWRPRRFKWVQPFRRKTKSVFCACAITFQLATTTSGCRICILSCNVSHTLEEGIYMSMCLRTEFWGKYLEQEQAVGHSCLSRFRIKLREQTRWENRNYFL